LSDFFQNFFKIISVSNKNFKDKRPEILFKSGLAIRKKGVIIYIEAGIIFKEPANENFIVIRISPKIDNHSLIRNPASI